MYDEYIWAAYIVGIMFGAASVAKGLGVCVVAALGMVAVYPNINHGAFIFMFFIPALLLSAFRD